MIRTILVPTTNARMENRDSISLLGRGEFDPLPSMECAWKKGKTYIGGFPFPSPEKKRALAYDAQGLNYSDPDHCLIGMLGQSACFGEKPSASISQLRGLLYGCDCDFHPAGFLPTLEHQRLSRRQLQHSPRVAADAGTDIARHGNIVAAGVNHCITINRSASCRARPAPAPRRPRRCRRRASPRWGRPPDGQ